MPVRTTSGTRHAFGAVSRGCRDPRQRDRDGRQDVRHGAAGCRRPRTRRVSAACWCSGWAPSAAGGSGVATAGLGAGGRHSAPVSAAALVGRRQAQPAPLLRTCNPAADPVSELVVAVGVAEEEEAVGGSVMSMARGPRFVVRRERGRWTRDVQTGPGRKRRQWAEAGCLFVSQARGVCARSGRVWRVGW